MPGCVSFDHWKVYRTLMVNKPYFYVKLIKYNMLLFLHKYLVFSKWEKDKKKVREKDTAWSLMWYFDDIIFKKCISTIGNVLSAFFKATVQPFTL